MTSTLASARSLELNVAALKPTTSTLAEELAEHARAAFRVERREP